MGGTPGHDVLAFRTTADARGSLSLPLELSVLAARRAAVIRKNPWKKRRGDYLLLEADGLQDCPLRVRAIGVG